MGQWTLQTRPSSLVTAPLQILQPSHQLLSLSLTKTLPISLKEATVGEVVSVVVDTVAAVDSIVVDIVTTTPSTETLKMAVQRLLSPATIAMELVTRLSSVQVNAMKREKNIVLSNTAKIENRLDAFPLLSV